MTIDLVAWLVVRIVYAGFFLYALKALFADWQGTIGLVKLIMPASLAPLGAVGMVIVMLLGALGILFGVYGQIAGLLLCVYCLLGACVHYRLAKTAPIDSSDPQIKSGAMLAVVGHVTSAQKNFVLAAMAFFFMLMGTGPASLTVNLWG